MIVETRNFSLTCDEMGEPAVAGHGQWHLNFDSMTGPMMGMMTMARNELPARAPCVDGDNEARFRLTC